MRLVRGHGALLEQLLIRILRPGVAVLRFNFLPSKIALGLFTLISFLILVAGQERHSTKAIYHPTGAEASITGTIAFSGKVPKPRRLKMESDPACQIWTKYATSEDVVVHHGKLAN